MTEPNHPVLQQVSPSETEEVEAMARSIWPAVYSDLIPASQIEYMLNWMYAPEKIRTEIKEERVSWFWIELGDERVGFLAGGPLSEQGDFPLHKIYLLPESQGKGLGGRAMKELFSYAAEQGSKRVQLRVNRENTQALRFYESQGFLLTGMDKAAIGDGFVMDDCLLAKQL